jgi:hypothetical protein
MGLSSLGGLRAHGPWALLQPLLCALGPRLLWQGDRELGGLRGKAQHRTLLGRAELAHHSCLGLHKTLHSSKVKEKSLLRRPSPLLAAGALGTGP